MNYKNLKNQSRIFDFNIFGKFSKIKIIEKKFTNKIFRNCIIESSFFNKKNFDKVEFWKIDFLNCKFCDCKFTNVLFSEVEFKKTSFYNCLFDNVIFAHSYIKSNIFKHCEFKKTKFNTFVVKNKKILPSSMVGLDPNKATLLKDKKKFSGMMDEKGYYFKKQNGKFKDNDRIFLPEYKFLNKIPNELKKKKFNFKFKDKKFLKNSFLNELIHGNGFVKLNNKINSKDLKTAISQILNYDNTEKKFTIEKRKKQFYLNNLFKVHKIFEKILPKEKILKTFSDVLGPNFFCGFYGSNFLGAGARGQRFHFDYPYPTMYRKNGVIQNFDYKSPINLQAIILLSDLDDVTGSTDIIPGSQKLQLDPQSLNISEFKGDFIIFKKKGESFKYKIKKLTGKKGTIFLFNGLAWHRAGDNLSLDKNRITLLLQFLSNHIRPLNKFNGLKKSNSKFINQLTGNNLILPTEV